MKEEDLLAEWSRLGILWCVPASRRTPDVEQLIVRSLSLVGRNPRVLILLGSWLSVFWRCVGRDRLVQLALAAPPMEQAVLGIALETADVWIGSSVFSGCAKRLSHVAPPYPLLEVERERPALARLSQLEASPVSCRWGLWCRPIEPKLDAIRPVRYVMETNPSLKTRAMFKGSLKTSLLAAMRASGAPPTSPTELAHQCGVTRKAVYDAIEDLKFVALLPQNAAPIKVTASSSGRLHLTAQAAEVLSSQNGISSSHPSTPLLDAGGSGRLLQSSSRGRRSGAL